MQPGSVALAQNGIDHGTHRKCCKMKLVSTQKMAMVKIPGTAARPLIHVGWFRVGGGVHHWEPGELAAGHQKAQSSLFCDCVAMRRCNRSRPVLCLDLQHRIVEIGENIALDEIEMG